MADFLRAGVWLLLGLAWWTGGWAQAPRVNAEIVLQNSLLAGFRHHDGKAVWDRMATGDVLDLVREPNNPHDGNAVRVEWQGHKLGYVPRRENQIAKQMDAGLSLTARITKLEKRRGPWRRIEFDVTVDP